ncbi:MAG: hypothetical protein AABX71_02445 [Nanoarchaeota archaeon]
MVHWPTKERQIEYANSHLKEWVSERPGQYFLVSGVGIDFKTTFYEIKEALTKDTNKPLGTFYSGKIPTHLTPDSIAGILHSSRRYIKTCPYSRETILPDGGIEMMSSEGRNRYSEHTQCPECGVIVWRKPSRERLKEFLKHLRESERRKIRTSLEAAVS